MEKEYNYSITKNNTLRKFFNGDLSHIEFPEGLKTISRSRFYKNTIIKSITLPLTLEKIEFYAFGECKNLKVVKYRGTKSKWNTITKDSMWAESSGITKIECTDGTVTV